MYLSEEFKYLLIPVSDLLFEELYQQFLMFYFFIFSINDFTKHLTIYIKVQKKIPQ